MSWLAVLLAAWLLLAGCAPAPGLSITILDVGQGSAAIITAGDGRSVIVDGGRSGGTLLDAAGELPETVELVIASHADADHIGGLAYVVEQVRPRFFMDNGLTHETQAYASLLDAVQRAGSQRLEPGHRHLNLGDVRLTVLPPPYEVADQNPNSVGLLVTLGGFRLLLPGDATTGQQLVWLRDYPDLLAGIDVYVAAHHGAATGDSELFLRHLDPQVVIISVGQNNPYGHPARESLENYAAVEARVVRTDESGSVRVLVSRGGVSYRVVSGTQSSSSSSSSSSYSSTSPRLPSRSL